MKTDNCIVSVNLLRIVSMLFVVALHILGHGGILSSTGNASSNYFVAQILNVLAQPAVDMFLLISVFVGYRGEKNSINYKNIINLFLQVLFYSFFIALLFKCVYPDKISTYEFIKTIFPVMSGQYWFFAAYFAMFLVVSFSDKVMLPESSESNKIHNDDSFVSVESKDVGI